jgi:pilus assembly protein CpaB
LFAAVAASLVVYYIVTNVPQPAPTPVVVQGPTPVPQKSVVIAATDISAGSVISREQITTGSYPADLVPADAITRTADVLNTAPNTQIFSGQILLHRQFSAVGAGTDGKPTIISNILPPGKVLVAFPSTDMLNATGVVQPGDHVDIMLSIPVSGTTRLDASAPNATQIQTGQRALVSQVTLQNVVVYSMGEWTPPGQQAGGNNSNGSNGNASNGNSSLKIITFIVDHQEALILKYVKDSGGTIDLAVRSAADNKQVQTDPVTLDYLVDLFGFIGLVPPKQTPTP